MKLKRQSKMFARLVAGAKEQKIYPYFKPISQSWGPEVIVDGRKLIMAGSNDYLGLAHDPRVIEAAVDAIHRWGAGPGGSRFLSGNMSLHDELEQRLARFVNKKMAVVHTTGFLTNLGVLGSLITPTDVIVCDREDHASIFEGCRSSGARIIPFAHNDRLAAKQKIEAALKKSPDASVFLITEGVFSMSGDCADLTEMVKIKEDFPDLTFYLDDAHGLGVMGGGKGSAAHFGVTDKMDYIMGTFSKAFGSIGGFIASDDTDMLTYLKHHSKTLIFSAALPACNAATVLKCLDIIESEPERVEKLWRNTERARAGYKEIGLHTGESKTPIIPVIIGQEDKAYPFAAALFEAGVFALPAVFPAVPKGQALIRTAFMSTHEEEHIAKVLEVLDKLAKEFKIRIQDFEAAGISLAPRHAAHDEDAEAGCAPV